MHVPDGFLSPALTLPAYAAAAPLWAFAARRHFGRDAVDALPAMGALAALAFVVQTIAVPVPGGTSAHLGGVAILALRFHPLVAFVCESLVLLVQAAVLGAGGVTTLAVNALAIGLVGPLAGWLAHAALRRASERAAGFAAGWAATQASSLAIVGALALQHALDPSYLPAPPAVVLAATMLPSLAITGVVEGLYTAAALSLLRRARLHGAP